MAKSAIALPTSHDKSQKKMRNSGEPLFITGGGWRPSSSLAALWSLSAGLSVVRDVVVALPSIRRPSMASRHPIRISPSLSPPFALIELGWPPTAAGGPLFLFLSLSFSPSSFFSLPSRQPLCHFVRQNRTDFPSVWFGTL